MHATHSSQAPDLKQAARHLARLLRLARPYWGGLGRNVLLGLAAGALGVAVPYVTKLLIDEVWPRRDVGLLHVLVALLLALTAATALAGAVRAYFAVHLKARLGHALRLHFFNHLQHLPMRFYDGHQVGEIGSRFQGVASGVDTLSRVLEAAFSQGVFLLLVPPVLLWMDWRLALWALALVPAVAGVTALAGRRLRHLWQESSELHADLSAYQVEVLGGIRIFKGLALERRVFGEARRRMRSAAGAHLRASRAGQVLAGLGGLLRAVGMAGLTWYGWTLILSGRLTLGELVAFTAYVGYLYTPLFLVLQLYSQFQESAVHVGRMFDYLDETPEQDPGRVEAPEPPPLPVAGGFDLRGVSFAYAAGSPVLREVDLTLPAGTITAVVGASGSGKTTLLRLLCGFVTPDAGVVRLDGRPLADVPLDDLRRQVAVVWQGAGLVRGTLWENLTLGCRREPSRERVDEVVASCRLAELVAELPLGYGTRVAEAGASLSAGQQQRVAMARALLIGAPVLLLDEATANVDVETEGALLRELFAGGGRTLVFVTHRLAAAALAPRVVVMERGRVAGVGGHDDLLAGCASYRRLHGLPPATERPRALAVGEAR